MRQPEDPRSAIHVCSLAALNDVVAACRATHVVTVINPWSVPDTPPGIRADNHLKLAVNDIAEAQPGLVAPEHCHITELLEFIADWDCSNPIVIHCLAGISRSTAAAFITACALNPGTNEFTLARALRHASRTARPNSLMIELADEVMARDGRMVAAIESIGHGNPAIEAKPFLIPSQIV